MIITDVKQIDRIAEETFGKRKGFVLVDMKDYTFIKEHSKSLKLIKLDVSALTEDVVHSLDDAITEAGKENVNDVLLYIKGVGNDAGKGAVTIGQLNIFIECLNKNIDAANIIWGMGEGDDNNEYKSILVILGYL